MKTFLEKSLVIGAFIGLTLVANQASADAISVFSIGNPNAAPNTELIQIAQVDERSRSRRPRGESYHGTSRERNSSARHKRNNSSFNRRVNEFVNAFGNDRRGYNRSGDYSSNGYSSSDYRSSDYRSRDNRRENRQEYRSFSYTSPPLRGGSSRRTRIIENPYADRLVTGITLTGVDNRQVHIKDVAAYPGRYLLSPLAYSLSQYERPRFINTQNYIDYISVAAKRKEYFTVTFHYD